MNNRIEEINGIIDSYEKKKKKRRMIGIPLGIVLLIGSLYLIFTCSSKSFVVSVSGLGGFLGVFTMRAFRMGTKHDNKYLEQIISILEDNS